MEHEFVKVIFLIQFSNIFFENKKEMNSLGKYNLENEEKIERW